MSVLYNSYGHLTNFIAIGIYIRSSFCKNSLIPYDNYLDKHRNCMPSYQRTPLKVLL
jgi:hypothetical protein